MATGLAMFTSERATGVCNVTALCLCCTKHSEPTASAAASPTSPTPDPRHVCCYFVLLCRCRGYLGTGAVDFRALFRGLASINYSGPITFESFSSEVVSKDLSSTLCIWRDMWGVENSDDLARHARAFIQQEWTTARITAVQARHSTPSV